MPKPDYIDRLEIRIDEARTIILAAATLMPSHGLLAEQWEAWRRDAEKWLDR